MSTSLLDSSFLLLLGAAGVWVFLRFVLGPRRGAPAFSSFFAREKAEKVEGLGTKAIATLLSDTQAFVGADAALRGLLLAGPFAARAGTPASPVTLIAVSEAPESYLDAEWLLRWAYPARGHKVISRDMVREPGLVCHRMTLRGAPPVEMHFVASDRAAPPEALRAALREGVRVVEDSTGQAERLRRQWDSLGLRAASPTEDQKENTI